MIQDSLGVDITQQQMVDLTAKLVTLTQVWILVAVVTLLVYGYQSKKLRDSFLLARTSMIANLSPYLSVRLHHNHWYGDSPTAIRPQVRLDMKNTGDTPAHSLEIRVYAYQEGNPEQTMGALSFHDHIVMLGADEEYHHDFIGISAFQGVTYREHPDGSTWVGMAEEATLSQYRILVVLSFTDAFERPTSLEHRLKPLVRDPERMVATWIVASPPVISYRR